MYGLDFASYSIGLNWILFLLGAAIVWKAGTILAIYVDALAERTGIGRAFLGLVLLAGITELPELATSLAAITAGNAPLAVNNLFGGIVMQTAILAIADLTLRGRSLSFFTPKPDLLLQGVLLMLLLGLVLAGLVLGEPFIVASVGAWTILIFLLYLLSLWLIGHFEGGKNWRPIDFPDSLQHQAEREPLPRKQDRRLRPIGWTLGTLSLVILGAGILLAGSGEAIAEQTGLGSSFVGATLVAATTSLPELSTTLGAVRLRAYSMAFGNIFGSNAIMLALLFLSDVAHREGPILASLDRSASFAAAMGIVVTGVYMVGLIMRKSRVVLGMGLDSLTVLILYGITIVGFYLLRTG